MTRIFLIGMFLITVGCASHATRIADNLDTSHPRYQSTECRENLPRANDQDRIKWTRTMIGPLAIFATGGVVLVPVVLANLSFDTKDQMVANDIAQSCGGDPKSAGQIMIEVGGSAALNAVTAGTNLGPAIQSNQNTH